MGRHRTGSGYVNLGKHKFSREHQMVMVANGVVPQDSELIHHKDEDKRNNDPSNLQLMDRGQHTQLHRGTLGEPDVRSYVDVICPSCLGRRRVRYSCTKLAWFTGLCKACNGRLNGVHQ